MILKGAIPILVNLLARILSVSGHGNMVFPYVWMDEDQLGWWEEGVHVGGIGCGSITGSDGSPVESPKIGCLGNWFTNDTKVPHSKNKQHHPWDAPGTAPIFSACGSAGGNPGGCTGAENEKFGDCCGGNCGGYSFGDNAEEYSWPKAPITEWKAGSYQEVTWFVNANHLGGYIYRLCKLPKQGVSGLTEECFQDGSLKFEGDKLWYVHPHESIRQELNATRITEGTFPLGSEWTEILVEGRGHLIDYLKVPADLDLGEYVLSFRWDCKKTAQIWNVCA